MYISSPIESAELRFRLQDMMHAVRTACWSRAVEFDCVDLEDGCFAGPSHTAEGTGERDFDGGGHYGFVLLLEGGDTGSPVQVSFVCAAFHLDRSMLFVLALWGLS